MAIKLKTEEGFEFSFDTVEELMEFKRQLDADEASKESEDEIEVPENESKLEVGDKVRIVSSEDGTDTPYHYHDVGSVGKVVSLQQYGRIAVEVDCETQYLLPHHYEKVEPLGKDANGEDLFVGDMVTGINADDYYFTNSTVDMEVLGEGSSFINEEANILVRIIGETNTYSVDSSKFLKLSDKLDEAKTKFEEINGEDVEVVEDEHEFKVGDKVRVVGNRARHDVDEGEVREITRVDSEEPKYNLSKYSCGSWAHSEDIKLAEEDKQKIEVGDLVYVRESFTDSFGDEVKIGTYAKVRGFGSNLFLTGVLVENKEQLDKLVLVAKKEDISI